jgi:hypothetical protein
VHAAKQLIEFAMQVAYQSPRFKSHDVHLQMLQFPLR